MISEYQIHLNPSLQKCALSLKIRKFLDKIFVSLCRPLLRNRTSCPTLEEVSLKLLWGKDSFGHTPNLMVHEARPRSDPHLSSGGVHTCSLLPTIWAGCPGCTTGWRHGPKQSHHRRHYELRKLSFHSGQLGWKTYGIENWGQSRFPLLGWKFELWRDDNRSRMPQRSPVLWRNQSVLKCNVWSAIL